jgi:hypothetical protein
LKRTGFSQERTASQRTCAYDGCGRPFVPVRPLQAVCSPSCAGRKVKADKAQERAKVKTRKEAIKTRRQWIAEAQAVVNKYCRLRDMAAGRGCISCGAKPEARFGGAMDAGHWRSVGSAPHLRFFTPQIRLQCVKCNRFLGGAAIEFRKGLVDLLGLERVDQIEAMQGLAKWDIPYLQRLKKIMSKKVRRLEKRHAV